jgi:hypothetical protein
MKGPVRRLYAIEKNGKALGQYHGRTPAEAVENLFQAAGSPLARGQAEKVLPRFNVSPVKRGQTRYSFNNLAGCVTQTRSHRTGTLVGLYHSVQAGIEDDPETPWTTVCEKHGSCVCHATMGYARQSLPDPTHWCDDCRELHPDPPSDG